LAGSCEHLSSYSYIRILLRLTLPVKHQREAGASYFDPVLQAVTGGQSSTAAITGSTEAEQFEAALPAL